MSDFERIVAEMANLGFALRERVVDCFHSAKTNSRSETVTFTKRDARDGAFMWGDESIKLGIGFLDLEEHGELCTIKILTECEVENLALKLVEQRMCE